MRLVLKILLAILLGIPALIVLAFVVLVFSGGKEQPLPPILHVTIKPARFEVPQEYIVSWARGMRLDRDNSEADGLDLSVTWPSMQPFKDPDPKESVDARFANELTIAVRPADREDIRNRAKALDSYATYRINDGLVGYGTHGTLFGLQRFSEIITAYTPSGPPQDDLLVYPSLNDPETLIDCTADQPKPAPIFFPSCNQHFYPPNVPVRVKVNYRMTHLQDWQEIQRKVSELLASFSKPAAVPPAAK